MLTKKNLLWSLQGLLSFRSKNENFARLIQNGVTCIYRVVNDFSITQLLLNEGPRRNNVFGVNSLYYSFVSFPQKRNGIASVQCELFTQ